jgi:hypothetical protein
MTTIGHSPSGKEGDPREGEDGDAEDRVDVTQTGVEGSKSNEVSSPHNAPAAQTPANLAQQVLFSMPFWPIWRGQDLITFMVVKPCSTNKSA